MRYDVIGGNSMSIRVNGPNVSMADNPNTPPARTVRRPRTDCEADARTWVTPRR